MSGCQGQWTVWSFCPTSWWWRSAEACPAAPTTCPSVRGCSTRSWLSITDTRSSRLCSATTFSTSTPASRSYSVRGGAVGVSSASGCFQGGSWGFYGIAQMQISYACSPLCFLWSVVSERQARASSGGPAAELEAAGLA